MRNFFRLACGAALLVALSACNSSVNPPSVPGSGLYGTTKVIAIPGAPLTTSFSFDISFIDPTAGQYYLADRSTKGIDVITTSTQTFVSTAGAGSFVGVPAAGITGPNGPIAVSDLSGPNGVVPVGGGIVAAGDGNSTLKFVNVSTGAVVQTVTLTNPVTTGTYPCGTPTTGAANARADELAYDPTDKQVLIINDAACPPFGTFVSTTNYAVTGQISFTTSINGAEQPTWDPTQSKYLVPVPGTTANPNGELDVIAPNAGTAAAVYPEPAACQGNGTALGPSEHVFLGCSNTAGMGLVIMNATNGATVATIPAITGCDEVWYNPTANRFYGACSNNPAGALVAVVDAASNTLITTIATGTGAHSVAVDPSSDTIYVPERGPTNFGVVTYH